MSDWRDHRACRDVPPRVFHELAWDIGKSVRLCKFDDAATICGVCPVRAACLKYAISLPEVAGVFAGYDPKQIAQMKRSQG